MVTRLVGRQDQMLARELIEANGFRYEDNYDVMVGAFDSGRLIATAARDHYIFKMICIDEDYQGGSLLGELLTALLESCVALRRKNFFVFTRPERRHSFEQVNFKLLVEHPQVCLLEYGNGLQLFINQHRAVVKKGENGAIVMNANPFTRGHQFLVEQASSRVDHLYLFVVREDCSIFPFEQRYQLVRDGVSHLGNVSVIETADYAVSRVTFPSYFLKSDADAQKLQMEIDLLLFARRIAPEFHIVKRFVGTEPLCRTTRHYNEAMQRVLSGEGLQTVELNRIEAGDQPISASRVRRLMKKEAFESLSQLVPETTLNYLRSMQTAAIREELKDYHGRH